LAEADSVARNADSSGPRNAEPPCFGLLFKETEGVPQLFRVRPQQLKPVSVWVDRVPSLRSSRPWSLAPRSRHSSS